MTLLHISGITSPPPVIRTYYLNIELVNNANTTVIIEFQGYASPIRLPYLGVARIYEIINAVNQPAGISYRVYEEGGNNATLLYLNGQEELTVTPSTKDEVYRIIITGVGKDSDTLASLNDLYPFLFKILSFEMRVLVTAFSLFMAPVKPQNS